MPPDFKAMEDMYLALRMAYYYDSIYGLIPLTIKLEKIAARMFPYTAIAKAAKLVHLKYDVGLSLDTEISLLRALDELKEVSKTLTSSGSQ